VDLDGCEALGEATRDCRLVLLTATEAEAEPLLRGLREPRAHVVATKKVVVGLLGATPGQEKQGSPGDTAGDFVRLAVAIGGCDKTNTAHLLTCLLQAMRPKPVLVLQVGVAGAFPRGPERPAGAAGSVPAIGDLVIATEEAYSDTGSSSPAGWLSAGELQLPIASLDGVESGGRFPLDPSLVQAAVEVVEGIQDSDWPAPRPAVFAGPCVTASLTTGVRAEGEEVARRWGALAESMEGAAAAHVCALYEVPFLEVRGISNLVVDRDRSSWEVDRAARVAGRAALAVAAALDRLPLPGQRPPSAGA
jgi:futalosine hydrolase